MKGFHIILSTMNYYTDKKNIKKKESIKELWNSNTVLRCGLLFFLYFVLQISFANDFYFDTDEFDIYLGGKTISKGYLLYLDYTSQHMPISYYISAVFDLLGADGYVHQRVCFYLLISSLWTFIYERNRRIMNPYALVLYPLLFLSGIQTYELGTCILSEHLVAIGAIMLLLEFYRYYESKELENTSCFIISAAIVLMFGASFVSILAVGVIGIAYFMELIKYSLNTKRLGQDCFKEVLKLLTIIITPWVVIAVYFALQDNLGRAIYFVYKFNTTVYSKYYAPQYANTLFVLATIPLNASVEIMGVGKRVVEGIYFGRFFTDGQQFAYYKDVLQMMLVSGGIMHVFQQVWNKRYYLAVIDVLYFFALSFRGIFGYHGTQDVALLCLFSAIALCDCFDSIRKNNKFAAIVVCGCLFLFCMLGYMKEADQLDILRMVTQPEKTDNLLLEETTVIDAITDDSEAIGLTTLSNSIALVADRAVDPNVGGTPWFWEVCKDEWITLSTEELPRVVLYSKETETWGYKQSEYAPELAEIINSNYIFFHTVTGQVYIRKDYYREAVKKIGRITDF